MPTESSWQAVTRQAAARYLTIQGSAGVTWWALLYLYPESHNWFFPDTLDRQAIRALALPDLLTFVAGSFITAAALRHGWQYATLLLCMLTGATIYATLYCVSLSLMTSQGILSTALMLASSMMSFICIGLVTQCVSFSYLFRPSPNRSPRANTWRTLCQTSIFWTIFLLVIPAGLKLIEFEAELPTWQVSAMQQVATVVLFVLAGALGIASGTTMALVGNGTPLPLDAPRQLVIAGPYQYIRNPMAVAGLLQGAAVGVWLGSPLVLIYVFTGGLIWDAVVRPLEEHDLQLRFTDAYLAYQKRVRCWLPKLRPGRAR